MKTKGSLKLSAFLIFLSLQGQFEEMAYFRTYTSSLQSSSYGWTTEVTKTGRQTDFHKGYKLFFFFQIWTLRKGFLFLGKEIKSASRSSMKEIKVLIDASSLYQYLPCPHRQKVPKEKAQCPERAFCFVFQRTGHGNNTHLDLSGNPKSGSPNITNTASSSVKAVNCSLH